MFAYFARSLYFAILIARPLWFVVYKLAFIMYELIIALQVAGASILGGWGGRVPPPNF